MATIQDYALEKQLVRLEQEIQHLKANQDYGVEQIQKLHIGDIEIPSRDRTITNPYLTTTYREVSVKIDVTGIYPTRPLQVYMSADHLPHLFLFDIYVDSTAMNYIAGSTPNTATIRFFHGMLPAEYQAAFTAHVHIYANMPASFIWEYT